MNAKIWDIRAEVFIPCAGSRMITEDQLDRMISNNIEVISAGANVPFADPEIFFGKIAHKADTNLALIPDFISNCGMARVFAYLMSNDLKVLSDEAIFSDTSDTIYNELKQAHEENPAKTGIANAAFQIALNQLI